MSSELEIKRLSEEFLDACESFGYIIGEDDVIECCECGEKGKKDCARHRHDCPFFLYELLESAIKLSRVQLTHLKAELDRTKEQRDAWHDWAFDAYGLLPAGLSSTRELLDKYDKLSLSSAEKDL